MVRYISLKRDRPHLKYVLGTDEKRRDLLMVLGNQVMFAIILSGVLFLLWFSTVIARLAFTGSAELILLLIGCILALAGCLCGLYEGMWRSAKYFLDETGITIVYFFHSRHYPWSSFQKVFQSKISRGVGDIFVKYDYLILMISECGALAGVLSLPNCWRYQSKFLVVRSTEKRIWEFRRYCTISDPPDIKPYQYPY